MTEQTLNSYDIAVHDFQRARRTAALQQILARLQGKSDSLLCYNEVRRQLQGGPPIKRGLQEIPLEKIVGSVGRYQDFTRSFLPKNDSNKERWARVKAAITDMKGMPPIDVYQLGEVYFVNDGNHRVSVARQLGVATISAYVTEIETRVPLSANDDPDEVICKARYADFLEKTNLDKLCPGANLLMTFCGQYHVLLDQIETECRLMNEQAGVPECDRDNWDAAVVKWYEDVYLPVVQIIRDLGGMRRFPERTEADIYVLLTEQREDLEEALGWHIDPEIAVPELIEHPQERPLLSRMLDTVAPGLDDGPAPGGFRQRQLALHREHHLFENILVVLEGIPDDRQLLEQVIHLTHGDHDHILGLHVVKDMATMDESAVEQIRINFEQRIEAAGLDGEFAVDEGRITHAIIRRAAWADLVVINLTHPPEAHPLARLRPGWAALVQRCPRPLLVMPNAIRSEQDRLLLAYDGSAKADEALFVATYLTSRWRKTLTVLTVKTNYTSESALNRARDYLQSHGITWADYVLSDGPINEAILETAAARDINLLVLGGFGLRPALQLVLGSTVEHMLREFKQSMLICR
ncbi:MAG: universal stress protein [Anaerolineae bacterium]